MSGGPQGRGPSYRDEIVATELFSSHFGLTGNPFSLVPDPSYLFWSPLHRKAYTVLEYGMLTGAPITVLTGEVGTGKTTLIRNLLDNAPDDLRDTLALILDDMTHAQAGDILGVSEGTISWRISEAKKKLRALKEKEDAS